MNLSLNTHHYDGKIAKELIPEYETLNINIKELIGNMISKIELQNNKSIFSPTVLNKFKSGINVFLDKNNIDKTDNIDALFLLYLVYKKIENIDVLDEYFFIIEQICDITDGPCPQGRSKRLIQCLY